MRRPVWALHAFVVGLALHNVVMAELWQLGVRGVALDVVSAWKEVVLALALVLVVHAHRGVPFRASVTDWLALTFGALVVLYALIPQAVLGGHATHKGVLFGVRHDLLPVAAYFLGRGLDLTREDLRRLGRTILATAAFVASVGLVDVYLVPLQRWRDSGAPGWFHEQLGLDYRGLSRLPENFVYNQGDGVVFRRLVSTFMSPLASAYLLVVALLLVAVWRRRDWVLALVPLLFAALLWTHTRAGLLALAVGLVCLAWAKRRWWPAIAAVAVVAVGLAFVKAYPHFGPRTHFTASELRIQQRNAREHGVASTDATTAGDASTKEHLTSLREGARTVAHHPWGFGVGNAGVTAFRTDVRPRAGESTYTELGVETGLLGALVFIAWSVALVRRVTPRSAWLGSALVALLFLGLQTDVIGVPWLAYVVFALAGDCAAKPMPAVAARP